MQNFAVLDKYETLVKLLFCRRYDLTTQKFDMAYQAKVYLDAEGSRTW